MKNGKVCKRVRLKKTSDYFRDIQVLGQSSVNNDSQGNPYYRRPLTEVRLFRVPDYIFVHGCNYKSPLKEKNSDLLE